MTAHFRWTVLLGLCVLAGCGGGGGSGGTVTSSSSSGSTSGSGSSSSSSGSSSSSSSGGNVVTVTVNAGPPAADGGTFNIPYTSVTICQPGTSTCATINDVLVDTGSYGLRIMASALKAAGLAQVDLADPNTAGNTLAECLPFADGYTWGPLMTADVRIGGELAPGVTINIINDNDSFTPTAPNNANCANSNSTSLNSVAAFAANGVLGVGVLSVDCVDTCADCASLDGGCNVGDDVYYTCNTSTDACGFTQVAQTLQVQNPVALFAVDNNGIILSLPSIPAAGQVTASGTLTFGIGTESNNALSSAAVVITTDDIGNFTTIYNSQTLNGSFIDSGSNALYFPNGTPSKPTITLCPNTQSNPDASDFYCPATPVSETALNQGQNGSTSTVPFEITNANSLNANYYATPTIGGPATPNAMLGAYFDWGLPFFYGRFVYVAIDGQVAGTATGPYYAYSAN
jgi:hypothetical protein